MNTEEGDVHKAISERITRLSGEFEIAVKKKNDVLAIEIV